MRRLPGEPLADFAARARAGSDSSPGASKDWDADLIPAAPEVTQRSAEQLEIDAVLAKVDIVEAYRLWCGKMDPNVGNKRENIMVSCPNPAHPDRTPSAAINLDKGDGGVGDCYACELGFDKYDIAAWHFGFSVPGYKDEFPELRRRMAEGLGYRVMVSGKDEWLERIQPDEAVSAVEVQPPSPEHDTFPSTAETKRSLAEARDTFDWRDLPAIAPGTFLHEWLSATSELYEPEEFYVWLGFVALGCAVGNHVVLDDEPPVRANVMTCLVGSTGTGKSRAMNNLHRLMTSAMPFDAYDATGVRQIESAGSGEALLDQFVYITTDPSTQTVTERPIVGLYVEDEFEALMARINKPTSTFRPYLMKFFDSPLPVSTNSRTSGSKVARNHFMQMVSSTQDSRIGSLTTSGDAYSGFLNRWFFVYGTPKERPALSTVRLDLGQSVDLLRNVRAWGSNGRSVKFIDDEANAIWSDFVHRYIRPVEANGAVLAARIELLCKKLLLLFAINQRMTTVAPEHLETLRLLFPYLMKCCHVVEEQVGLTDVQGCVNAMMVYFTSHPEEAVTARTLAGSSAARKYELTVRNRAIEAMIAGGYIEEVPRDRNTRTTKYRLAVDAPELTSIGVLETA